MVVGVKQNDTTFTQYGCDTTGGTSPPVAYRPGADCLTGALRIAYADAYTHGGSDGYCYSNSHSDGHIYAYGDCHIYSHSYGHVYAHCNCDFNCNSNGNIHADTDWDAGLPCC